MLGSHRPATRAHLALWAPAGHTVGVLLVSPASYPTSSYMEVLGTQEIDSQEFILSQASGNRRKHPCKEMRRIQSEAFKPRGAHEWRWCCGWTPTQVDRNQLLCYLSFCVTLGAKGVVTGVTELRLSLKVIAGEMTLDILGGPNVITRVLTREKQEGQRVRR